MSRSNNRFTPLANKVLQLVQYFKACLASHSRHSAHCVSSCMSGMLSLLLLAQNATLPPCFLFTLLQHSCPSSFCIQFLPTLQQLLLVIRPAAKQHIIPLVLKQPTLFANSILVTKVFPQMKRFAHQQRTVISNNAQTMSQEGQPTAES